MKKVLVYTKTGFMNHYIHVHVHLKILKLSYGTPREIPEPPSVIDRGVPNDDRGSVHSTGACRVLIKPFDSLVIAFVLNVNFFLTDVL